MFKEPGGNSENGAYLQDDMDAAPEPKPKKTRRVQTQPTPGTTENVLIIDSAADQSCVGQGFKVLYFTGASIHLDGALDTMSGGSYPLVTRQPTTPAWHSTNPFFILTRLATMGCSLTTSRHPMQTDMGILGPKTWK